MPVLFYLCFDFLFLCANAGAVLVFVFFVFFKFRDQYLFLFCLPYLLKVPGNSFLITSLDSVFYVYGLLLGAVLLLFVPFFALVFAFYLLLPTNHYLTLSPIAAFSVSFLLFFSYIIVFVFCVFLPSLLEFLSSIATSHYSLINIVFDITAESWLRFSLVVALSLGITFLFYILTLLILYFVTLSHLFFVRFTLFLIFFLFVVVCLPYDSVLHVTFIGVFVFLMELPILLRFVCDAYSGRVA
jgi:hypothetical protein